MFFYAQRLFTRSVKPISRHLQVNNNLLEKSCAALPLVYGFNVTPTISLLHTSVSSYKDRIRIQREGEVSPFYEHNLKKYPIIQPGEERRPAFVCHEMRNIKYSKYKMWYCARLVRGLKVEDAINQLKFCHKKGAVAMLQTILEAQRMAVNEHNVEFPSNLWVSESFYMQDSVIKGIRRHAKGRMAVIKYEYVRYCCTLEEGTPPKDYYYYTRNLSFEEKLEKWVAGMRQRNIQYTL